MKEENEKKIKITQKIVIIISLIFTMIMHIKYRKKKAKSILPGILSLITLPLIIKEPNIIKEPYEKQNKYANIISMYIGHIIGDIFFIYKDKGLLFHHIITLIGAINSLLNKNLRNISISLLVSEILPVLTYFKEKSKIGKKINIIRILISICYRIPLIINIIIKTRDNLLKTIITSFISLELYWLLLMIKPYLIFQSIL